MENKGKWRNISDEEATAWWKRKSFNGKVEPDIENGRIFFIAENNEYELMKYLDTGKLKLIRNVENCNLYPVSSDTKLLDWFFEDFVKELRLEKGDVNNGHETET